MKHQKIIIREVFYEKCKNCSQSIDSVLMQTHLADCVKTIIKQDLVLQDQQIPMIVKQNQIESNKYENPRTPIQFNQQQILTNKQIQQKSVSSEKKQTFYFLNKNGQTQNDNLIQKVQRQQFRNEVQNIQQNEQQHKLKYYQLKNQEKFHEKNTQNQHINPHEDINDKGQFQNQLLRHQNSINNQELSYSDFNQRNRYMKSTQNGCKNYEQYVHKNDEFISQNNKCQYKNPLDLNQQQMKGLLENQQNIQSYQQHVDGNRYIPSDKKFNNQEDNFQQQFTSNEQQIVNQYNNPWMQQVNNKQYYFIQDQYAQHNQQYKQQQQVNYSNEYLKFKQTNQLNNKIDIKGKQNNYCIQKGRNLSQQNDKISVNEDINSDYQKILPYNQQDNQKQNNFVKEIIQIESRPKQQTVIHNNTVYCQQKNTQRQLQQYCQPQQQQVEQLHQPQQKQVQEVQHQQSQFDIFKERYRAQSLKYVRQNVEIKPGVGITDSQVNQMSPEEIYEYFTQLDLENQVGFQSKIVQLENKRVQVNVTDSCTICMDDIQPQKEAVDVKLDCNHQFHYDCIRQWLLKQKFCPVCKLEVDFKNYYNPK